MKMATQNYVKESVRLLTCSSIALSVYFFLFEIARVVAFN